jgi:SAM-dependent methyltransferase
MGVEEERLEAIAEGFSSRGGYNASMSSFAYRSIRPYFVGVDCLELGCSDGQMTRLLVGDFRGVVAVDGSATQIERLKRFLPARLESGGLQVITSLAESLNMSPIYGQTFGTVLACYLLEHVEDPVGLLTVARDFLGPSGVMIAVVPNANSIHRMVGQHMGLMTSRLDLSDQDRRDGHRRTYTVESLVADFTRARMSVEVVGGVLLKPLPANVMQGLSLEVQEGLFRAGRELPCFCSSIFVVARG